MRSIVLNRGGDSLYLSPIGASFNVLLHFKEMCSLRPQVVDEALIRCFSAKEPSAKSFDIVNLVRIIGAIAEQSGSTPTCDSQCPSVT